MFSSVVELVVMESVVLLVHQRPIQLSQSMFVVLRFKRVMLLQSVRFRDCLRDLRLLQLLRSVMTLVLVEFRLLLENLLMDFLLT